MRERLIEAAARAMMATMMKHDGVDQSLLAVYMIEPEADQVRMMALDALDAILTVLAEPDEEMVKAGNDIGEWSDWDGLMNSDAVFQAMIGKLKPWRL